MATFLEKLSAFKAREVLVSCYDLSQVEEYLVDERGETLAMAQGLVKEFKRFALLKFIENDLREPFKLAPSGPVDEVWHAAFH